MNQIWANIRRVARRCLHPLDQLAVRDMLRTAAAIEDEARENKHEQTMRLMADRLREQAATMFLWQRQSE
jgi:hypothetical protein